MQVTAKVVYPVLSILLNDSAEAFLSSDGVSVQIKFQGVDDRIAVITPFGVLFFGIPLTLLFSAHNWRLVKALTYYHITLTFILPILFSVFFKPWVWIFVPTDFSHYLSQFLGMSFCLFALKGIYNEHCKIRKASVV